MCLALCDCPRCTHLVYFASIVQQEREGVAAVYLPGGTSFLSVEKSSHVVPSVTSYLLRVPIGGSALGACVAQHPSRRLMSR